MRKPELAAAIADRRISPVRLTDGLNVASKSANALSVRRRHLVGFGAFVFNTTVVLTSKSTNR
jgi:hypothetical protein